MDRDKAGHHGSFSEGMASLLHDDGRVGRYGDGLATRPRSRVRVGRFSDGIALLEAPELEGRFSTGMERAAPLAEPRRIRPRETPPRRRAA